MVECLSIYVLFVICLLCVLYSNSSVIESRKDIFEMLKSLQAWLMFISEALECWSMAEFMELLYTCCERMVL